MADTKIKAEVISVFPNKVRIAVNDIEAFKLDEEVLVVGSYLKIFDHKDCSIIAIIENFSIEIQEPDENGKREKVYIVEAIPLGFLNEENVFIRGGNNIAIPPKTVEPAKKEDIQKIYDDIEKQSRFCFSKLVLDNSIKVPVDGNKFFNKHIAIVGSTGSGKSHTLAKIIQQAISTKNDGYKGLNNSHIVLFDIHDEYKQAFPTATYIDVDKLKLPYWLMNTEELEEMFLESGDFNNYNQSSILSRLIVENKELNNSGKGKIEYGSPVLFKINEVLNCLVNLSKETKNYKNSDEVSIAGDPKNFSNDSDKYKHYFKQIYDFEAPKSQNFSKGNYADGSLDKFISRLKNKLSHKRLKFLFSPDVEKMIFEDVIRQFISYKKGEEANVTIIDLSGVPFEVLSITVSLISRILFDYAYFYKKTNINLANETPLLIVYEEAHKYVPKNNLTRYNASRFAIERIAKEGRKYGITAVIVSQRPSEISETIFSQCNNFISMRLTNPDDQNYVKRLLPDTLGPLTETLPMLQAGEALLIGDSVIMPSLVSIDHCDPSPSSNDIKYLDEWKKQWKDVSFGQLIKKWQE